MGGAIKEGLKRWSDYRGRYKGPEFWWVALATILLLIIVAMVLESIESKTDVKSDYFFTIIAVVVYIPLIALGVRRLHDTGKSGWHLLLFFIPLIGPIVIIVLMSQKTQPYAKKWGQGPGGDEDGDLVCSLVSDNE